MNKLIKFSDKNFYKNIQNLLKKRKNEDISIDSITKNIIEKIRVSSDKGLIFYTNKFDGFNVNSIKELVVTEKEINESYKKIDKKVIDALKHAEKRIKSYHNRQLPKDEFYKDNEGVNLGSQWKAIDSVGLYVPGGKASYPSSVLMNAIPAIVAGVKRIVMVVPSPKGTINPIILAVAKILGINEIYKVGGAQAIAALAIGTDSIKKVDKICGPGNAYVASAKKQLFGSVGIDMIAGPSEILVLADRKNNPKQIAIDLLSQAEHDELAQSILITDNEVFAYKVKKNIINELKTLERRKIAKKSWEKFGSIIIVKKISDAIQLINEISPEHLELAIKDARKLSKKINNAGSIFIGRNTPEAIGDYIAGPNHILPTDRTAKFSSGLNVLDFLKRISLVECDLESLKKIGPNAILLAKEEGLGAHALSISSRIDKDSKN